MTIRRAYLTSSSPISSPVVPAAKINPVQPVSQPPDVPPDVATAGLAPALTTVVTDELARPNQDPAVTAAERSIAMDKAKGGGEAILGELVTCMNGFAAYWESDASGKRRLCIEEATGDPPCAQKAHGGVSVPMERKQGTKAGRQGVTVFIVPTATLSDEEAAPAETVALDQGASADSGGTATSSDAADAAEEKS